MIVALFGVATLSMKMTLSQLEAVHRNASVELDQQSKSQSPVGQELVERRNIRFEPDAMPLRVETLPEGLRQRQKSIHRIPYRTIRAPTEEEYYYGYNKIQEHHEELRQLLRRRHRNRKNKMKEQQRRRREKLLRNRVELKVPYPVFIPSLPKSGTTTTHRYFECGGQKSAHLAGRDEEKDTMFRIGSCAQKNVLDGRPPFEDCGDYEVWSDTGVLVEC
mgnify:CR=1 FL=1